MITLKSEEIRAVFPENVKLGKKSVHLIVEPFEVPNVETTIDYFLDLIKGGLEKAYTEVIKDSKSIVSEFLVTDEKGRYVAQFHVTEKLKTYDVVVRYITSKLSNYKETNYPKVVVKCRFRIPEQMLNQINRFRTYLNQELKEVNVFFPNIRPYVFQTMNNKGIDSSYIARLILQAKDSLEVISRFFENNLEDNKFFIFDGKTAVLLDATKDKTGVCLNIIEVTKNPEKIEAMKVHSCVTAGESHVQ